MQDPQQPSQPPQYWRLGSTLGVGIGVGMLTGRTLEAALSPSLGGWGAFAVGILAGAGAGIVVGLFWLKIIR
jgi:hypothetical protein